MQRGMLRGIAAFRWGAWGWMAAVLIVQREDLRLHASLLSDVAAVRCRGRVRGHLRDSVF